MGYHKREISKGQLGEASKIIEEMEEISDAVAQNCKMLILCELCDLLGAIEAYSQKSAERIGTLEELWLHSRFGRVATPDFSKTEDLELMMEELKRRTTKRLDLRETLSELVGAASRYALQHDITFEDLVAMKDLTKQAFEDGTRR